MKPGNRPRTNGRGRIGWLAIAAVMVCFCGLFSSPRLHASKPPHRQASTPPRPQAAPHRIISLIPSVTEMLFAMGAGDDVIAVSSFDHYPPEAEKRRKVGGLIDPDFELILSLRPDLVIVYGTQGDLIGRLDRAHIPMFNYEHAGLADVTQTIRKIGLRIGHAAGAETLAAGIERDLAAIRARTARISKPSTLLVFEREAGSLRGMFASGSVGFLHDMLEVAGGTNVFADVKRQSLQLAAEQVLARAPEVIIEIHSGPGWTPDRIARERDVWRGLSSVPAVRTGRIYLLVDEMVSIPGPRVAEATRMIARVLHPDVFGK